MQSNSKGAFILLVLLVLVGLVYVYQKPSSVNTSEGNEAVQEMNTTQLPREKITVGSTITLKEEDIISSERKIQTASSTYIVVSAKEVTDPKKNTVSTAFEACSVMQNQFLCRYVVTNSQGNYVELKQEIDSPESYRDIPGSFAKLIEKKTHENDIGIAQLSHGYFDGIAISTSTYPYMYAVANMVQGDTKSYEKIDGYDPENIVDGKPASKLLASQAQYATLDNGSDFDDYITLSGTYAYGLRVGDTFRTVEIRAEFATTTKTKTISISSYDNDDYKNRVELLPAQPADTAFQEEGRTNMYNLDDVVIFITDKHQYRYSFKANTLNTLPK